MGSEQSLSVNSFSYSTQTFTRTTRFNYRYRSVQMPSPNALNCNTWTCLAVCTAGALWCTGRGTGTVRSGVPAPRGSRPPGPSGPPCPIGIRSAGTAAGRAPAEIRGRSGGETRGKQIGLGACGWCWWVGLGTWAMMIVWCMRLVSRNYTLRMLHTFRQQLKFVQISYVGKWIQCIRYNGI